MSRKKGDYTYWQLGDRDWLYQKYWVERLSSAQIANIVGCSPPAVRAALKRHNIKIRTLSEAHRGERFTEERKRKMSKSHEGKEGPWRGKQRSEEAKRKISVALKGRHKSEETKQKLSDAHKGKHLSERTKQKMRKSAKKRWESKEERERMSQMRRKQKMPRHHTKIELIFEEMCKKHNLPFHYVGDGQLWIGKKGGKHLNPDFIECNGKKIAVEIFGDYWHSLLLNPKLREDATLPYRKKHYKKYGWRSIFLWESDILRKDAERFVLSTLKKI